MSKTAKDDAEENEGFVRGFHGIPDDAALRAMSYTDICELLSSCEKGTTKHSIVEREKVRRDIIENAKLARPSPSFWFHPAIRTALYILGVVVAGAILVFFGLK